MTILSFCALFPLLHVVSLQPCQHPHTFLLSFSMCSSSFPCCEDIACTFRPGYVTHLYIYGENLEYTEVNSHLRFSPLIFFFLFDSIRNTQTEFFRLFHTPSPAEKLFLKNYSVKLFILCNGSFANIKLLLRKNNHQQYLF